MWRRLTFQVEARDEAELICEGTHQRVVVSAASFAERIAAKSTRQATDGKNHLANQDRPG